MCVKVGNGYVSFSGELWRGGVYILADEGGGKEAVRSSFRVAYA